MKRYVLYLLLACGVGACWVQSWREQQAEAAAKAAEAARRQAVQDAVDRMVKRTEALTAWPEQLPRPMGEVPFSIELERLWIHPRPILFQGWLKDVTTTDNGQYQVVVESQQSPLQLSLYAKKSLVDAFLHDHPRERQVAVVARITAVRTVFVVRIWATFDALAEEVKVGDGELVELLIGN